MPAPSGEAGSAGPAVELLPIPDIPLSTNPLRSKEDGAQARPRAELKPLLGKMTVAVVDDDLMMLDVLSRILQREISSC